MYKDLQKDVASGLTFRQLIIGFAPAVCGQLNRNQQLVPKSDLRRQIQIYKKELKHLRALTDIEAEQEHHAQYAKEIAVHDAMVVEKTELRKIYVALIEKVQNWDVDPYYDTIGQLRFLALRDLSFNMEQACYIAKASPIKYSGEEWKENKIKALEMMVADYEEAWKLEKDGVKHVLELLDRLDQPKA